QRHFPPPLPMVRRTAAIHLDQQPPRLGVTPTPDVQPPTPDGRHRERWRIVRRAHQHVTVVVRQVVDTHRDRPTQGPTGEIVVEHILAVPSPRPTRVLEVTHPLLLFRIDANDWQTKSYIQPTPAHHIPKLLIPVEIAEAGQPFAVGPQAEAEPTQQ